MNNLGNNVKKLRILSDEIINRNANIKPYIKKYVEVVVVYIANSYYRKQKQEL